MRIGHNLYLCPYCSTKIRHTKDSRTAEHNPNTQTPGRHTVTSTLTCPKCGRDVSQRTSEGLR